MALSVIQSEPIKVHAGMRKAEFRWPELDETAVPACGLVLALDIKAVTVEQFTYLGFCGVLTISLEGKDYLSLPIDHIPTLTDSPECESMPLGPRPLLVDRALSGIVEFFDD